MSELQIDDPEPCPTGEREYIILNQQQSDTYSELTSEERFDLQRFTSAAMARRALRLGLINELGPEDDADGRVVSLMQYKPVMFEPQAHFMAKGRWSDELSKAERQRLRRQGELEADSITKQLAIEIEPAPEVQQAVLKFGVRALRIFLSATDYRSS